LIFSSSLEKSHDPDISIHLFWDVRNQNEASSLSIHEVGHEDNLSTYRLIIFCRYHGTTSIHGKVRGHPSFIYKWNLLCFHYHHGSPSLELNYKSISSDIHFSSTCILRRCGQINQLPVHFFYTIQHDFSIPDGKKDKINLQINKWMPFLISKTMIICKK